MRYRRLGNTDLTLSAVGLGGWPFGGGYDWGPLDPSAAEQAVAAALDSGINWIDTAPIYGESEALLGRVLGPKRKQLVLATKCGLVKDGAWPVHDLRPKTIVRQAENSLRALRTDYIDLYQVHYRDPQVPWADVFGTLTRLREQGKIRWAGACNLCAADAAAVYAVFPQLACVQNEYSLLHPAQGEEVFGFCAAHGVGFIGYGSLCGGILSGKYKKEPNLRRADARNYFYRCYRGADFTRAQQTVARVRETAARLGCTAAQTALAWACAGPQVSSVLCGARTAQQARENAAAGDMVLPERERVFLQGRL